MENEPPIEGRHSRRDRLMGRFFDKKKEKGREKNQQTANDISAFLGGGSSDRLQVVHPPPPPPAHGHREYDRQQPTLAIDTRNASRYPHAGAFGPDDDTAQQSLSSRARSHSPPRTRKNKGLVVRFVDSYPEIIGEGGDECPTAVAEIGRRKRSRSAPTSAPIPPTKQGHEYARQVGAFQEVKLKPDDSGFSPGPLRRTQTGYVPPDAGASDHDSDEAPMPSPQPPPQRVLPVGEVTRSRFLDTSRNVDENRRSFIEIQSQEQRQAEGMAFAEALRSASANSHHEWDEAASSPESVRTTPRRPQSREVPPVVLQDPSSPPPYRSQSHRAAPMEHESLPLRAQSATTQVPLPMPQSPPQPLPPRNPARRSPLPPVPPHGSSPSPLSMSPATRSPGARSPMRSPLPQHEALAAAFEGAPMRSMRPMSPDDLRVNTQAVDSSPDSNYSGSVYSSSELPSHQTNPSLTSTDRGLVSVSPDKLTRTPLESTPSSSGTEAFDEFILRTKHLYELFRLHAEQYKPLSTCRPEDMCRAALWWFLKGRMGVEAAVRNRGADPDETKALMGRYQAYTDLTKAYWLTELAIPEVAEGKFSLVDGEFSDIRQAVASGLRKLTGSMKRNNLLPPEEPFMPQMMDKSVWLEYPSLSSDMTALLNGNWGSLLAASSTAHHIPALEALPLGDTPAMFNYGRVSADVYLMEQGLESTQNYFPCMLSINRQANESNLVFTVASQNGSLTLRIRSEKGSGPCWENVRWRSDANSLELKMPRGFLVAIQLSQQDFRMLWNIFDFGAKVQSYLYPKKDEQVAFRGQLRSFHYLDADPKARTFPKEPVGQCEIGLYERLLKEGSPTGPRTFHRGFRLAVVTGPRIRTLSGVTHVYPPSMPVQYSYLRGEQREPLLQLVFSDGKNKARMVLAMNDESEREKLISLMKGSYIHNDEELVTEVPLQGFFMSETLADSKGGFQALQRLPWQAARIINDKYTSDSPQTVLAEKLRLEITSMDANGTPVSTVTDRINVAPGEFKMRLGTKDILTMQVFRHPQLDMTLSILDRPGMENMGRDFTAIQNVVSHHQTIRTYRFSSFKDLHAFQEGVTGYTVLFDGVASSLNISRRRMVVPVYKKWESGTARIQVVQQEKTIQLLAFFEQWHHGECMGMVLKGTDVFEAFGKGNKAGLKLVDAKFPLPKVPEDGNDHTDDMAFVCLDMPDYAGEHDDISIVFDDEAGKLQRPPPSTDGRDES